MSESSAELMERKQQMRRSAYDARNAQENKDSLSEQAIEEFLALDEYREAGVVMWYIDCRSELRTQHAIPAALASGKKVVVPYCTVDGNGDNKLGIWWLENMDELVVGKWKILEPPRDQWGSPDKEVAADALDLVMVPGVGFGRDGSRMGNGQGYYDRLLEGVDSDCPLVGICFESQLFDDLVVGPHDICMDKVVTELTVYRGRGRA